MIWTESFEKNINALRVFEEFYQKIFPKFVGNLNEMLVRGNRGRGKWLGKFLI